MKVYERSPYRCYDYPEDMVQILNYLNTHGEVLVGGLAIEKLYYEFSEDKYCAGWMSVSEDTLREFENWLDSYRY